MQEDSIQLAGCILLDDYGRMLLLHRNQGDLGVWELPGGKVESEELPADAAVREMQEELGVSVELLRGLGKEAFEHDGRNYLYHWFLATITSGNPSIMEAGLFDDLDYVEVEDLPSLSLSENMLVLQNKILTGEVELS